MSNLHEIKICQDNTKQLSRGFLKRGGGVVFEETEGLKISKAHAKKPSKTAARLINSTVSLTDPVITQPGH